MYVARDIARINQEVDAILWENLGNEWNISFDAWRDRFRPVDLWHKLTIVVKREMENHR
jgi:hypothetical protein